MGLAELLGPEQHLRTDLQRHDFADAAGQPAPRRSAGGHDQQPIGAWYLQLQQDHEAVERRQRVVELPHAALVAVQLLATGNGCDAQLSVAAKRKNAGGVFPAGIFLVESFTP